MFSNITDENFESTIQNGATVLVDFYADWCGPCKILSNTLMSSSKEFEELGIKVYKVDIEESINTASKFGIMGVPTLMLFKNGKLASTKVGSLSKASLIDWIKENNKAS